MKPYIKSIIITVVGLIIFALLGGVVNNFITVIKHDVRIENLEGDVDAIQKTLGHVQRRKT